MSPSPSSGISLLPEELQVSRQRSARGKKANVVAISILVAVAVISGSLFGGSRYLLSQKKKLISDIAQEKSILENKLSGVEGLINIFTSRLNVISTVLKDRVYYSDLLTVLGNTVPEYVQLKEVSVSGNEVRVTGTALNYLSLASFVTNVGLESKGGRVFSGIELTGVSQDKRSGAVQFSAKITIVDEGLKHALK